ncbi:MAG: tetratricopeptide repeat protein [Saccharofermentanales bacterium]
MDWHKLIRHFKPLTNADVSSFAPAGDVSRALNTYNRALTQLHGHNADIALIALRKLAASYPDFTQSGLLYGLVLASMGRTEQARHQILKTIGTGLTPDWQEMAEHALAKLNDSSQVLSEGSDGGSPGAVEGQSAAPRMSTMAPVLEKTGRRSKMRMASAREREDVIRQGEYAQDDETHVKMRREPAEYLRVALPVLAILLVAGLLIFFVVGFIAKSNETRRMQQEATARLDWLLSQLASRADQDEAIGRLLADYEKNFATEDTTASSLSPTTEPPVTPAESTGEAPPETSRQTESTTTAATTTIPTTAPTQPIDQQALLEADDLYRQAVAQADGDVLSAGNLLLEARSLLAEIPGETAAPGVQTDATGLSRQVETLIGQIAKKAAEANRKLGMNLFNDKVYEEALDYFLTGYALYPRAYGGGVAYYCGLCYQMLGDFAAAKPYYEFVISQYPDRDIAGYARNRLNQMGY